MDEPAGQAEANFAYWTIPRVTEVEKAMSRKILLLGNPLLREKSAAVRDFDDAGLRAEISELEGALDDFRRAKGFGRGLSAPQLGIMRRIIALNLGEGTFVLVNPRITARSDLSFTMWDDCMSFPDLLVKVRRSLSISVEYQDGAGAAKSWEGIAQAEAELLQHEIDHLDGILAVDRASDVKNIIYRSEFEAFRDLYEGQVDYVIKPTIKS
jgi:peptide deformylase